MEMKQVEYELCYVLEQVVVVGQEKSGFIEEIKEMDMVCEVVVQKLEKFEEEEKVIYCVIYVVEFVCKVNEFVKEEL